MNSLIKNILVIVIVAVVVYGIYLVVSALDLTEATFQKAADIRADTTALETGILADLTTLDVLEIDSSFLNTPEYQTLRGVTEPQIDYPASRENPFLPVR